MVNFKENATIGGKALGAKMKDALCVEMFLNENYRFRRNVLNGKVEFASAPLDAEGNPPEESALAYRPLTQEALNSIVLRAKREEVVESGSPKDKPSLPIHDTQLHLCISLSLLGGFLKPFTSLFIVSCNAASLAVYDAQFALRISVSLFGKLLQFSQLVHFNFFLK